MLGAGWSRAIGEALLVRPPGDTPGIDPDELMLVAFVSDDAKVDMEPRGLSVEVGLDIELRLEPVSRLKFSRLGNPLPVAGMPMLSTLTACPSQLLAGMKSVVEPSLRLS